MPSVDADTVIRRARRRRTARQVAVGSTSALAVAAIVVLGVNAGALFPHFASSASDTAALHSSAAPEPAKADTGASAGSGAPTLGTGESNAAQQLNQCGAPVAVVRPNSLGLVVTLNLPATAAANGQAVTGTATLINTGTALIAGTTHAPTVVVSQDGITRWHSHDATQSAAIFVNLAPGQSMTFTTTAQFVSCDAADEGAGGFRTDLPALASGKYQVSGVLGFVPDGDDAPKLISGPASDITLG